MLFIKTLVFDPLKGIETENFIRQNSLKRHVALDLQSSSYESSFDEKFLATENEKYINVCRCRTSIALSLPKIILRFDKAKGFTESKVRLSFLSTLICAILFIAIILNLIYAIDKGEFENEAYSLFLLAIIYFGLINLELYFVKSKFKSFLSS